MIYKDLVGKEQSEKESKAVNSKGLGEVVVQANLPWNGSGVYVQPGATIDVHVRDATVMKWKISDAVYCGPDGDLNYTAKEGYALPGAPEGCLVAKIGDRVYQIGWGGTIQTPEAGEVLLSANDDLNGRYGAGYTDNEGAIAVVVQLR